MSYFENFVGFKTRSKTSLISAATQTYDSYARQGDDPSGEGSPILNSDGTQKVDEDGISIGNDFKRGNGLTRRWGDTEGYQVGNTYTKLEGDAVAEVVGNSSAKRTGWVNNVTLGPTFNTQIGGTITTSLFTVNTLVGFRCSTFGGMDVAWNLAPTVKITMGEYIFDKLPKFETAASAKVVAETARTDMITDVKNLIDKAIHTYATGLTVIAADVDQKVGRMSTSIATMYDLRSASLDLLGAASLSLESQGPAILRGSTLSLTASVAAKIDSSGPISIG